MGALQAVPQAEVLRPITRYARTVSRVEHVLRELDEAVAFSEGHFGEPGPAFIDFPTDLLREEVPEVCVDPARFRAREPARFIPMPDALRSAVDILWAAKRPLVISGRGARGAEPGLSRLLDSLGCVYMDTAESRGLVPEDHPAYLPAMRGRAMQEADAVLTVGRTLDFQLGYGSRAVFPQARFVRIGTSPGELRGNRRAEVELMGSAQEVLDVLVETAGEAAPMTDRSWVQDMQRSDRDRRGGLMQKLADMPSGKDGAMHPYRVLGHVRNSLRSDAIVVADGGDFLSFARVALSGAAYLDCGPFGCLGVGVPFGIAAALAFPERQVVVVSGDGSFGFNAIELDTCRRHGARVVFIVANNAGWNIERNDQKQAYGGRIVGTELEGCDYAMMARSLGVHGERIERPEDLPDALERAFDRAPALLDVRVTRDAVSPDAAAGLPGIPNRQALSTWDEMEMRGARLQAKQ